MTATERLQEMGDELAKVKHLYECERRVRREVDANLKQKCGELAEEHDELGRWRRGLLTNSQPAIAELEAELATAKSTIERLKEQTTLAYRLFLQGDPNRELDGILLSMSDDFKPRKRTERPATPAPKPAEPKDWRFKDGSYKDHESSGTSA